MDVATRQRVSGADQSLEAPVQAGAGGLAVGRPGGTAAIHAARQIAREGVDVHQPCHDQRRAGAGVAATAGGTVVVAAALPRPGEGAGGIPGQSGGAERG